MVDAARQPEILLGWMGALGDPTRLRLLRLLEQHELGVAELCDVVQLPQSSVSRHLKVLADEGGLRSRRQGTVHLYRAAVADLGCGTGSVAAQIAPWVARVIGVDSSSAMLKAAARRTEALANVELRRG